MQPGTGKLKAVMSDLALALRTSLWPGSIHDYHKRFGARERFRLVAVFWLIAAVAFSIMPVELTWRPEHPGAVNWAYGILSFVLPVLLGNLIYALLVDIVCDLRIRKKLFVSMILTTLGLSAVACLVSAAALVGLYYVAWDNQRLVTGVLIGVIWWQWLVDACNVRALYGITLIAAFPLVVTTRVAATALAIIFFSILTGTLNQWTGFLR